MADSKKTIHQMSDEKKKPGQGEDANIVESAPSSAAPAQSIVPAAQSDSSKTWVF